MPKKFSAILINCPDIELNDQSLEILEMSCYLGDKIGARGFAVGIIITLLYNFVKHY